VTLGNIVGASKILRDITERKAIERALRENEERFRVLAENISQLTWMAEPDGTPFWYNRRWYDYTSLSPEESCGDGWKSVFHPEHIDRVVEGMQLARDGGASWEDTIPLRGKDGSYRWFLSRSMPVRDRDGRIVRWLGTNTDVTEKKMADDEREKLLQREKSARSDAERANHIKDEFLATLSHELRTPLNAILGWIHLIRKGNFAQDQVLRGIEVIERNSRVQAQLIADLLDMSRITSGKMRLDIKKTDPAAAMEATVESIRSAAEGKAIHLSLSFDQSRPLIHADPSRLQQIFWNLLSNAVKFTPRGGSISVTLEPLEFHIRICVKDTGKGIKTEFLPHVFERFRQADASSSREHSGLGLGLSIVRQLVELHGGAVRVESEGEGRGATFIVEFPLFTERAQPEAKPTLSGAATSTEAEPPPPLVDLRGISVLLVEDDDDAREMLRLILEYFGAQVFTASSATEGLQTCLSLHPTCIISDVGMPIHDGYKMMGWIRERGINTPAIALTAFARAEDKERAIDNGFNRHLAKPVDPDELARCVKQLVAEEVFASRHAISV
jgi:PAS domain S-box-containing protein